MEQQEKEISIADIINIIKKNIILEVLITLAIFMVGVVYTFAIATPMYESSATIMLAVKADESSDTYDYTTSKTLIDTVAALATEEIIILSISEEYDISLSSLKDDITVNYSSSSFLINITYINSDSIISMNVLNDIINNMVEETNSNDSMGLLKNSISITTYASEGEYASPNKVLYLFLALVIGGVMALTVVFIKELSSNKFASKKDIETYLNKNIIGLLPELNAKSNDDLEEMKIAKDPKRVQQFDKIFGNIKYTNVDSKIKTIQFTSTAMSELKSTTVANTAVAGATMNKIIVIDLDLRRPSTHKIFNVERKNGIVDLLSNDLNVKDFIKKSSMGVDVITAGSKIENPIYLLDSSKLKSVIEELRKEYDYIFLDTPPVTVGVDAIITSKIADATIYNVSCNQIEKHKCKEALDDLTKSGANIIGLVVSKVKVSKKDEVFYEYNYTE